MSPTQRNHIRRAAVIFSLLALLGTALYFVLLQPLIRAAFAGDALPFLAERIAAHRSAEPEVRTLRYYLFRSGWLYAWGILVCVFGFLAAAALILRQQTRRLLTNYFTATSHPRNLAIFRIVIFTFAATQFSRAYLLRFSALPEAFLEPPVGSGWLLEFAPPTPELVAALYPLFVTACIFAAAGLFTRVSVVASLLLGFYVLGVPNFYGKIDHYQHILWFMALLAVSPCADALSVDALVRSWRKGGRGELAALPQPGVGYALPLRFAWLLIGLCYFFPGLWKLGRTGFAWIFSDNFQNTLYRHWFYGDFVPFLRPDQIPFLTQASAAAAVIFELSFVFLVLFPALRPFAALAGFTFHAAVRYLMGISFLSLQVAYAAFVNWHVLFTRLGQRLFKEEATLVFDGERPYVTRFLSAVRVLDLLGRVRYLDVNEQLSPGMPRSAGITFVTSGKYQSGFAALRALSARVVGLWPLLPFLYVWRGRLRQESLQNTLQEVDSAVAVVAPATSTETAPTTFRASWRPTALVGTLLLASSFTFGLFNIDGWPLAAYPTFAGVTSPTLTWYEVVRLENGREVPLDLTALDDLYTGHKFRTLVFGTIFADDEALQQERLSGVWQLVASELEGVDVSDEGRFYRITVQTDPDNSNPVLARDLLAEFTQGVAARAAP